jgi:hypothetical protein
MAGSYKRGNEPRGPIKCAAFIDYPRNSNLLRKDPPTGCCLVNILINVISSVRIMC